MKNHADAPQALGNPNKGSSYVLLKGAGGDGYEPYQKSHSNFTMEAHDRNVIDLLRSWVSSHPIDTCMYISWSISAILMYLSADIVWMVSCFPKQEMGRVPSFKHSSVPTLSGDNVLQVMIPDCFRLDVVMCSQVRGLTNI